MPPSADVRLSAIEETPVQIQLPSNIAKICDQRYLLGAIDHKCRTRNPAFHSNADQADSNTAGSVVDPAMTVNYNSQMFEVRQTKTFLDWLDGLPDKSARMRIAQRIVRLQAGLFGDVKFFSGVGELRIDSGPGYRVYFVQRGKVVVVLLCGGEKSTQKRDIRKAIAMSSELDI